MFEITSVGAIQREEYKREVAKVKYNIRVLMLDPGLVMFITFSECWRRLDQSFRGTDSDVLSINRWNK